MLVHRIWGAIVVSSHLIRSFWPSHQRDFDQGLIDLRWEIARAEALVQRSSQELDKCVTASRFYSDLVTILGLLGVQLVVVLVFWKYCLQRRRVAVQVPDTDSEDDLPQIQPAVVVDKPQQALTAPVVVPGREVVGPLRPSDLRKLVSDGARSKNA